MYNFVFLDKNFSILVCFVLFHIFVKYSAALQTFFSVDPTAPDTFFFFHTEKKYQVHRSAKVTGHMKKRLEKT
jgi:hypothetical protein